MVPVWARQASGPTGLNRLLTVPALKEWLKGAPVAMQRSVAARSSRVEHVPCPNAAAQMNRR